MVRAAIAQTVWALMLEVRLKKRLANFTLDAEFSMPTPGVVALFGRSGCGKSTLVNGIAGLLHPDLGRIELDGRVLLDTAAGIEVKPERRRIGYVFQDARLFPHLSVEANLRYAQRRAHATVFVRFDEVVGLLDLGPLLARRTHQLSGGERQRIAIGRALLSQPRLLLLDEPLASIDSARRDEVLPYLETLRDQLAIPMVYVSHQFDEVLRLATHLVVMEAGATVAHGEIGEMSLQAPLRSIIGPDAIGAVLDAQVLGIDSASGLQRIRVGHGELAVLAPSAQAGARMRVQILARDVIVATEEPQRLSVRNRLHGSVTRIVADDENADLISIEIGGATILARITSAATRDLGLRPGLAVWALVKSVSLRGRSLRSAVPISCGSPDA
ncbi:MAG TPA: molybdenum ABC transporter ATP-binding protein [Steroidobacteraceae bacterium]|nr:molybdenum ABC transporter ATP-binding protein [Steroidobacteraceae bacterium]